MYELIISEKPQAAQQIANALGSPKKIREKSVNYFQITTKDKKNIIVASAVGHLYGVSEKGGESWTYPVFDTQWTPSYKYSKALDYTKAYVDVLTKLGKNASEITVACDFDIEGEVIGLNVVRFACKKNDANRMKFSTLTKNSVLKAWQDKTKHIDWGQAHAGETRHTLDWFYGINLSRAFTTSIKAGTGQFKVLSTGRVQAPALHFLAKKEKDIQKFKPDPFCEIYMDGNAKKADFRAKYKEDKIFDLELAKKIEKEVIGKNGKVSDVSNKEFKQKTPVPFDLTSLQMEASNLFGISPKRTLEIAQSLYINGWTSYPRTSSQKFMDTNLKEIIDKLKTMPNYKRFVEKVLQINPSLKPNEGKKDDPAHPAIHPTGEIPKKLEGQDAKIYDLIAKRFFAVFGSDALRETNTITIDVNKYDFILKGSRTLKKNWHELYEPYVKLEEVELPSLEVGDDVKNKKIERLEKETQPPKRYTDASIIKELEKRNLGTKATRADILSHLRNRGYIIDTSIKVTELGLKIDEVISKEVPKLVDEKLTREFEEDMEKIREDKEKPEKVLNKAKGELSVILEDIKKKEKELGVKLAEASRDSIIAQNKIRKCLKCDGNLVIKQAHKTRKKFLACDKYPTCKEIYSLPNVAVIKPLKDGDADAEDPKKIFVLAGKSDRSLKKIWINESQKQKEKELEEDSSKYKEIGMICPTCGVGKMVLRKSFYGEFLGCDNYPKCKTMMKIVKGVVDVENPIVGGGNSKKKNGKDKTKKNMSSKKKK